MDKYAVEKVIGEGTYGIVYKAVEKVRGLCGHQALKPRALLRALLCCSFRLD